MPQLSDEEVQRRIETRGGGSGPERPPAAHALRDRHPAVASRRPPRGTTGQNAILLVGLVVVGLVTISIMLPRDPETASSTGAPSGTAVAIAPSAASSAAESATTPALITLPPGTEGPVTLPPPTSAPPTVTPTQAPPTPTLQPGETPRPTPRTTPTPTPTRTPGPTRTPTPTKTPGPSPTVGPSAPTTATLIVKVVVVNDSGGDELPGAWTVLPNSAGSESPASFAGSTAGTSVTISAGVSYSVSTTGPSGYGTNTSANCSSSTGGLPVGGATETCTITKNDVRVALQVVVTVDGGPAGPSDWTVTVTGTNVGPDAQFPGSASGTLVRMNANSSFAVSAGAGPADYSEPQPSGSCTVPSGAPPGAQLTCQLTFTYEPPPSAGALRAPLAPVALIVPVALLRLRRRPWHSTIAGR